MAKTTLATRVRADRVGCSMVVSPGKSAGPESGTEPADLVLCVPVARDEFGQFEPPQDAPKGRLLLASIKPEYLGCWLRKESVCGNARDRSEAGLAVDLLEAQRAILVESPRYGLVLEAGIAGADFEADSSLAVFRHREGWILVR